MNYLVTGGFGFIGSHLTEKLLRDGHNVHVVDNLSTSSIDVASFIDEQQGPGELSHKVIDVIDYCDSHNGTEFDGIFHLAAVVGPGDLCDVDVSF